MVSISDDVHTIVVQVQLCCDGYQDLELDCSTVAEIVVTEVALGCTVDL